HDGSAHTIRALIEWRPIGRGHRNSMAFQMEALRLEHLLFLVQVGGNLLGEKVRVVASGSFGRPLQQSLMLGQVKGKAVLNSRFAVVRNGAHDSLSEKEKSREGLAILG